MKIPEPRKLKSGTWFLQLRLNGVSVSVTGATAKACKDAAALIKAEHRAGKREIQARGGELTLKQACERCIAKKEKAGRSPETIRGYDIITRCRFQSVMDKPVSEIKNWQELYDKEAERLSPKSMKNTWSFLKTAVKSECGIDLPEIETVAVVKEEHPFLDPDEIKKFVKAAEDDKYRIALYLALCSCRVSEIKALDWSNVDLKNDRIRIKGAMVRDKNNKKVDKAENKTEESARFIPIFIPELKKALNEVEDKTGKVVTANENTILEHADKVCDKAGLHHVGVHGLRHSFASLAYSLEVPIKITMQIGGWSDYNTVMKIYTHLAKKDVGKYSSEISQFFKNANKNANRSKKVLKNQAE